MYEYFFCILAYPVVCFVYSCMTCLFLFCDDHVFGGNKWSCRFNDTFRGWGVIN